MYIDYLNAIVRHYEERMNKSDLPQKLLQPSPSKIRDECVAVYSARFDRKDLSMLRSFFGVYNETDLLETIENFKISKFRPLAKYLKERKNTTDKNIELLGWLLDFPKRPYEIGYNYEINEINSTGIDIKEIERISASDDGNGSQLNKVEFKEATEQHGDTKSRGWNEKMQKLVVGIIILLGVGAAVYFSKSRNTAFGVVNPEQNECMIWADDHYERVSCDSPGRVGRVLPLDKNSLNNLRRITRPDTITEKYVGQLWYQKRSSDSVDYYTAGGIDPVDPNRDLKRLSWHIFEKNLRKRN